VEHCSQTSYKIGFGEVIVLAKSRGYMDRSVKEAIEIQLHPNSFNRGSSIHAEPGMVPPH
jgi:hypothetical protein